METFRKFQFKLGRKLLESPKTMACSQRYWKTLEHLHVTAESAKLRGFVDRMGYVGQIDAWVAWVYKILGWVGVGPKFSVSKICRGLAQVRNLSLVGVGPECGPGLKIYAGQDQNFGANEEINSTKKPQK